MTTDPAPRRGEVWLVSFDPAMGGEIQKMRPAVVLSNDTANALLNRVQVVPISSQVARLYPAEAYNRSMGSAEKRWPTSSQPSANADYSGVWVHSIRMISPPWRVS